MKARRLLLFACLALLGGCPDPVREQLEDAQGPEAPGVPQGPLHRAGQRCLACHREGGESPPFAFAGTVFARSGEPEPAVGVVVVIRDARGDERTIATNEVGNFWMPVDTWSPAFPLRTRLRLEDGRELVMRTEISREGSCNACHRGTGGPNLMPGVYVEVSP